MTVPGLRSRVVAVWLLLAGLAGAIAVMEYRDLVAARAGRTEPVDPRLLLPVPAEQLGALEIADAGRLHRFERGPEGAWFYHGAHTGAEGDHTHTVDPAAAQRIGQAVAAFGRTRIERTMTGGGGGATYGVTPPRVVILAYRPGERQPVAQYAVGDVAPDTVSRYVEIVGGAGVVTIPDYQIQNLLALIPAAGDAAGR
jgi:hypothetical protein